MTSDTNEDILSLQRIQNRLYSTSNQELPSLLTKLLPKLLPLANKEELRNATVGVISDCIRRIKSSKCIIDLEPLISSCIHPNLMPFACNFSFTLIDITLPFILEQSVEISKSSLTTIEVTSAMNKRNKDITSSLVHAIGLFEEFSVQSNSLCFYIIQLLDYLPNAINQLSFKDDGSFDLHKVKNILGNYAVDVSLLYRSLSIEGNAVVGSVQPGLSSMHIDRLTVRIKSWSLSFINDLKLKLISFIPMNIYHAHHSVLISIISVNDPNTEIAMQAMYKMKGVVNFYRLGDKEENTSMIVMEYLLEKCLPDNTHTNTLSSNNSSTNKKSDFGKRNLMKREIRATVLRWLAKHLHQYLTKPSAVKGSVMILFKYVFPPTIENFASLLTEDITILNAILRLVDIITKNLSHEELSTVIMLIFQCVKKILNSCITSFHTNLSSESGGEIDLRVVCYAIIENVSQRLLSINEVVSSEDTIVNPLLATNTTVLTIENLRNQYRKFITEDSDLLTILFKLLEKEAMQQYGSVSIVAIHSVLSTLRQAYITASNSTTIKTSSKLRDILKKARNNKNEPKIRVIALQWTKAIFEWDSFMIEALIDLIDDKNPQVAMLVISEFKHLKEYCLQQHAATTATTTAIVVVQSILDLSAHIKQQVDSIGLIYVFDIIATCLKLLSSANIGVIDSQLLYKLTEFILSFEFLIESKSFLTNELLREDFFFCAVNNQVYPDIDIDSKKIVMVKEKVELSKLKVLRSITSILQTIHTLAYAIGTTSTTTTDMETIKLIRKLSLQSGMSLYLNWLCIPEYQIRKDVGEILSLLCYSIEDMNDSIDLKFVSSLFRSLTISIRFLFNNDGTQLNNMYSAAGSIEALGYILVVLVQKAIDCLNMPTPPIELNALLKETKEMYIQLFSFIDQCLEIPFNNSIEMRVFQFVIIETLTLLANEGFIDAAELLHLELNKATELNISVSLNKINSTASEKLKNNSFFLTKYLLPSYSNKIFAHIELQIKNKDSRIAALAIELLSRLSLYYNPQEFISLIWNYLQDPELRHRKSYVYRFAWAEAIHRVSISGSLDEMFLKSIEDKLFRSINDNNIVIDIPDKSAYCVWLLIVTKELIHPDEVYIKKFSLDIFKRLLALFLKLLKENDVFIQDICCMGICYLYYISRKEKLYLNQSLKEVTGSSNVNIENYVTEEVITSLTREKRNIQPAGYSVAGTATNTSVDVSTVNHSTEPDNRNTTTTAATVNNGNDPLLQAAAIAANELGFNISFVTEDDFNTSTNRTEHIPQDYIIYSSICKLVKKTKSNDTLFLVLSLIKRDPTLSLQSNQTFISKYTSPFSYYENEVNEADEHHLMRINKVSKKLVDILPTLYHAKFDPNNTVRPVMIELWKTIVSKFFSQHEFNILDLIQSKVIAYLSQCLHSKLWRDREAACLALEAFLPQRSWSIAIYPCLKDIYCSGLRVLDDMRESTRTAALSFIKVLCNHIERACNPLENNELIADTAITTAIPLILEKGLINSSAEARGISLGLLGRIILVSKTVSAIRKWLPNIISVLVESMSALEPQTLQYMQFHTARLRISDEELENMRIKMSQSSQLQEALDTCFVTLHDVVLYDTNSSVISEIIECLSSAIRTGVGLATRVSAAQSIVQLVERYSNFLGAGSSGERSTANAFRSVVKVLTQMSSTATSLKKSITSAFGALSKVVDEDILASECEILIHRYVSLENANLEQSTILAECVQQIVQRSGSRLAYAENNSDRDIWMLILSTAFMGTHDFDISTKSIWVIIWEESLISSGVGSKISCLLKIFPKLLEIILNLLIELSWHRRIQGVSILRNLIQFISIQQISSQLNLDSTNTKFAKLLNTLLLLIPGKIWEGQSYVLEVLSEIVNKCKDYICWTTSIHSIEFIDGSIPVFEVTENNIRLNLENLVDFQKHKYTFRIDNMRLIEVKQHSSTTDISECDNKTSSIWKLNFLGWFMVLINECQRINAGTEYILVASRALHALPWQHLSSLESNCSGGIFTYLQLLPLLCKHAGIPLCGMNYNNSNSKSIPVKDNQGDNCRVKVEKTNRNKRLLGNDALFGVRYIKNTVTQQQTTATNTMKTQEQTTSNTMNIKEEIISNTMNAQEKIISNTMDAQEEMMNIQVQRNMQIDSTLLNLEQATINDDSNVIHDHILDMNIAVLGFEENNFPAFKCFFIECIVKGWPSYTMMKYLKSNPEEDCFAEEVDLISIASYMISWAKKIIECEIWSIKKAAILLVGTISNSLKLQSSDLSQVISIIELAIQETKFVKVRVEALKSLGLLLQGPNAYDLNNECESFSNRIRDIIKNTCTDQQPSVLEVLSKIQNLWLS